MDPRIAAHGLNIVAASRIYFANPIWQTNVEAQAIKRAHRIGQTKPVIVETLILQGTIEEDIFKRRDSLTMEELHATKSFTDDSKLRNVISAAAFLQSSREHQFDPFIPIFKVEQAAPRIENDTKKKVAFSI